MRASIGLRTVLGAGLAAGASLTLPARARAQQKIIRIGVLTDMAGAYAANTGPGSVLCTQMAIEDFSKAHPDIKVLYASNDMMAAGALLAAKGAGKDVKIIGTDGLPGPAGGIEDREKVFAVEADQIEQITLTAKGETTTLTKTDGVWKITAPVTADADSAQVSSLTTAIAALEINRELLALDGWQVERQKRIVDHGGCGVAVIRKARLLNTDLLRHPRHLRHSRLHFSHAPCMITASTLGAYGQGSAFLPAAVPCPALGTYHPDRGG